MVLPQKVNWDILYQSADKMASILLGLGEMSLQPHVKSACGGQVSGFPLARE